MKYIDVAQSGRFPERAAKSQGDVYGAPLEPWITRPATAVLSDLEPIYSWFFCLLASVSE